jgi:hypothetical protein
VQDARDSATLSTTAFVIGGVAAAGAVTLWLLAPGVERVTVAPAVAPGQAGVVIGGRF